MKVMVVSTSRADWNGLGEVAKALREHGAVIDIFGTPEAPRDAIKYDGFAVRRAAGNTVRRPQSAEGEVHRIVNRDATYMISAATAMGRFKPEIVLLVGDRHETLCMAIVAAQMGIPIAHVAGGDVTGGSLDEGWRHAITKIASVHFPTHAEAAARIINMGEDPAHVHMLGSPSVDRIKDTQLFNIRHTCIRMEFRWPQFILANWQPETPVDHGLPAVLEALRKFHMPVVFVGPNRDPGASAAFAMVMECVEAAGNWAFHQSLPPQVYLSALSHCRCLIGNSSSGFYEAPYYGTPVINVGGRQAGRVPVPRCMVSVPAEVQPILNALAGARRMPVERPYGDGAAQAIAKTILALRGSQLARKAMPS